jgi:transcriptional regulator with XRE-family HTH domain
MQDEYAIYRVGERMRRLISARGQSMKAFSDQSGIPYRSLQDYVAGKNRPGFEQLQKMAAVGVDVSFLLTGIHGASLLRMYSQHSKQAVLLSSDREVAELVIDGAVKAAQEVNNFRELSGVQPMNVQETLDTIHYSLDLAAKVSSEMDDQLCDLRRRGVSASAVTRIILESVSSALQKRVKMTMDAASTEVPQ